MSNWELLHHIADVLGIATIVGGFLWTRWQRWHSYRKLIDADHQKVTALWREHGYNGWKGEERRKGRR